jgi:proteasome-associated ATPase
MDEPPDPLRKQSNPLADPFEMDEGDVSLSGLLSREELDQLSILQILDLVASKIPSRNSALIDLVYLRERVAAMEETNDAAREALEKFDEIVDKLRAPALRMGTFLGALKREQVHVCVSGTDYVCKVDPTIPVTELQIGQRLLCNEAYAIVAALGFDKNGPIVRVDELLSEGRLRIGQEGGGGSLVVQRSDLLAKEKLKTGMDIRLDSNQRVALEVIGIGKRVERSLETVTAVPWSAIGGQDEALAAIRDTIELPFLHRDLFEKFEHHVPKGFLLHGPPGCGKRFLPRQAWIDRSFFSI